MEDIGPWSDDDQCRADEELPIEWELAHLMTEEEVPFEIPRD